MMLAVGFLLGVLHLVLVLIVMPRLRARADRRVREIEALEVLGRHVREHQDAGLVRWEERRRRTREIAGAKRIATLQTWGHGG